MACRTVLPLVAVIGGLFAGVAPAHAGTSDPWESVKVDFAAQDATFIIDFPHVPDFNSLDSFGRPADSFQIEIAADPAGPDPLAHLTTLVRGDEIHFAQTLPIRNASPSDFTDPHSGGWGTVRGTVPFTVSGMELSFTTPLSLLNATDGHFAYRIFTLEHGLTQQTVQSQTVPLPSAVAAGGAMLMLAMAYMAMRSRVDSHE